MRWRKEGKSATIVPEIGELKALSLFQTINCMHVVRLQAAGTSKELYIEQFLVVTVEYKLYT